MESTDLDTHTLVSPRSLDGEYHEVHPCVPVLPIVTQQFSPAATSIREGTASVEDSQLLDTVDVMPWLSWDWTEQMTADPAGVGLSLWNNPTGTSDRLLSADEQWSMGGDHITPDGGADDLYASLWPASTNLIDSKLDPVEHHRNKIIEHLRAHAQPTPRHCVRWLQRDNFQILLKTYFNRHHRHTPIIHLATFNVVSCPTSLIFAIALIAASYMPGLGLRTNDTQALAEIAYLLALHSDEVMIEHRAALWKNLC